MESDAPPTPATVPSPSLFVRARERVRRTPAADAPSINPNEELVASGLRLLRTPLALFICQGIAEQYGDDWWTHGVLEMFIYSAMPTVEDVRKQRRLPATGTVDELSASLDISACLILLTKQWSRIFGAVLGQEHRGWAYELIGVRNENKHLRASDHPSDYTWRALDTMYRLAASISPETARELLTLRSSVDMSAYHAEGSPTATNSNGALSPLPYDAPSSGDALDGGHESRPAAELGTPRSEDSDEDEAILAADFSGADLRQMDFSGADLSGANFADANLEDTNLQGASLVGADFTNASLGGANLTNADLRGARFEGTSLSRTYAGDFYGAQLAGAKLDGATLNFAGTDLRNVDLSETNLQGADFTNASLGGANLTKADLRGARLMNASLQGTNLTDADLRGASLGGSNVKAATTVGARWA